LFAIGLEEIFSHGLFKKILREKRRSVKLFLFFISRTPEPNRVRNIDKKRQMLFTSAFFRLDKVGF